MADLGPDVDPLNFEERVLRWYASRLGKRIAFRVLKWRGIDFPTSVQFGEHLRLPHGAVGLVVHSATVLEDRVKLYQGVTLGRGDTHLPLGITRTGGHIHVGSDVLVGANAVVLFRSGETLVIGDGAIIGAGAVVTRSVPAGEIWAGNPAHKVNIAPNVRVDVSVARTG